MPWVKIKTPSLSRVYYHNPDTDVTCWDLPPGGVLSSDAPVSVEEGVKRGYKRASLQAPSAESIFAAAQKAAHGDEKTTNIAKDPLTTLVGTVARGHTTTGSTANSTANSTASSTASSAAGNKTIAKVKTTSNTRARTLNTGNNATRRPTGTTKTKKGKSMGGRGKKKDPRIKHLNPHKPFHSTNKRPQQWDPSKRDRISSSTLEDRHSSSLSTYQRNKQDANCCQRFKTMPLSVWIMWVLPTLCFLGAGWYDYDANRRWTKEYRPATPNNTKLDLLRLGTDTDSLAAYAAANVTFSTEMDVTCQNQFKKQVSPKEAALCEGYCKMCALGGDTYKYPELPWALAGFWSVFFVATTVMFPMLRSKLCKKETRFVWGDLRIFLLLFLVVVIFSGMLFLIHQARVIAVPQGHSMFTFWVFFSSYFFLTTTVYWMRMDLQLIKARNPELALGAAVCGYIIVTNATGAYYLTGIQTWPCILSMITFYVIYPAYFLSFTRRGLELWVVVRHHKKVLKKMKSEEYDFLEHDSDDADDSDDEDNASVSKTNMSKEMFTYDPETEKIKQAKKLKAKKRREKARKKRLAKQKKGMSPWPCCCCKKTKEDHHVGNDIELGEYAYPSGKNFNAKNNPPKRSTKFMNNPAVGIQSSGHGSSGGGSNSGSVVGVRGMPSKRRLSVVDLKVDMEHHKAGRNMSTGKKNTIYKSKANLVRLLYWFFIGCGVLFCSYRYLIVRYKGEVGCIARQGNLMYFLVVCAVLIFQLITLFLLRKVKDEFDIRMELFYVTLASLLFMMPHIIMLFSTYEFYDGCSIEFVHLRAGVAFNNKPCTIAFYAYWLLNIMVCIIHTATISFPVGLTFAQGALKLREQSIITAANYKGPKLLASFESAVSDKLCSKYFRRFLAQEFTLDNMRFLVDVENFKTMIDPTYVGVLKSFGHHSNTDVASVTAPPPALARACHTISAWQTFSGNMPITLLSNAGKGMMKQELDLIERTQNAREIVKTYFSNEFWCNLYDVKSVKSQFIRIFKTLTNIMEQLESSGTNASYYCLVSLPPLFLILYSLITITISLPPSFYNDPPFRKSATIALPVQCRSKCAKVDKKIV